MLFERIDVKLSVKNDEAEAYLMEYLVDYVTNFLNQVIKKELILKTKENG